MLMYKTGVWRRMRLVQVLNKLYYDNHRWVVHIKRALTVQDKPLRNIYWFGIWSRIWSCNMMWRINIFGSCLVWAYTHANLPIRPSLWATSGLHHRKEFGNRGLLYVVDISYGWLFLNDVRQPIGWQKEVSLILLDVLFVIKLMRPRSTSLYVVLSQQIWLNVLQQAGLERISPFNAAGSFSSFVESVSQVDKQQRQGFKFTN